ncbi:MAG: hypothetical protein DHS20C14_08390 [Phycisphaeraceae bacterium]|nr:MAG: hypothetical protein DHS20C14_08390 [Phycisphaeraceae bacterium]
MLIRTVLVLAAFLALGGCNDVWVRAGRVGGAYPGAGTTTDTTVGSADELAAQLEARMIAFFPCASARWSEDNPHHMSYGLHRRGGWDRFVDTHVFEAIEDFGYRRVFFHLPFGKTTGQSPYEVNLRRTGREDKSLDKWHMSMDHVHDLRRTGNMYIADGFYSAMRRLHAKHPDVEVIVYVGSWGWEDRRYFERAGLDALMARWHESVDPLIELDYVSVVFDNAVSKDEDHPNARFVQWAHTQKQKQPGRFAGVEARIQKGRPWPNDLCLPIATWEYGWRRQGHSGNIPASGLCGPVMRIVDGDARRKLIPEDEQSTPGAWISLAADIAAEGHEPALTTLPGWKMDDLRVTLPSGRTVRLPESAKDGPYRVPVHAMAALIAAEVRERGD